MLTGAREGSEEEVPEGLWMEGGKHCDVLQARVMQWVWQRSLRSLHRLGVYRAVQIE